MGVTLASGLVIKVPEAEPLVAAHRLRLDPRAARGVPAHITVLYPFLPPRMCPSSALAEVAHLCSSHATIRFVLDRVAWFDHQVLWLVAADDRPFRSLTAEVFDRLPGCPPYGGAHPDPVPHLTVADGADPAAMRRAADALAVGLPISAAATSMSLFVQESAERWVRAARFSFAPGGVGGS